MTGLTLAAAAVEYVRQGWRVFPCCRQDKVPLTSRGFHDATSDLERVRTCWRRWPAANIGAPVPPSLAVLDVDAGHGGEETLRALEAAHGALPTTLAARTGGGGRHVYLLHPGGELRQGTGLLGPGLDTRMPGKGYVILPPSVHPSGWRYEWVDPATPVALMPGWLVARLRPPPPPASVPLPDARGADAYVRAAVEGEFANVVGAPEGSRNTTLHAAAVKLGTLVGAGLLSESEATGALLEAARLNGYTQHDGERAAIKTIRSGLTWGQRHPRELSR